MIDPLPSSTEVCIVGAGPSGLACALGLAARQIPFVIVDALEAGHNSSRAVLMQASALEVRLSNVHIISLAAAYHALPRPSGRYTPNYLKNLFLAGSNPKP
jgi:glycine/D-amino acid oxidase-like deaminating enzyme